MSERFKVAIIGSGPGGLSAAGHAAAQQIPHILIEKTSHLANTIQQYQKGKLVLAADKKSRFMKANEHSVNLHYEVTKLRGKIVRF